MILFYSIIFLTFFFYFRIFLIYHISWKKIDNNTEENTKDFVSIVVASRNEENNISYLIQDLKKQCFDNNRFEIIIIDDHSEDDTLNLVKNESKSWNNLRWLSMDSGEEGKKEAIKKGVSISKGSIILCTDADCRLNKHWIRTIVDYFSDDKVFMVSAPVVFNRTSGLLDVFQSLEFMALIGSGAASISRKKGTICNGANLSYRKSIFNEVESYQNDFAYSGDDVFLMHNLKNKYPNSIRFAMNLEAIVETPPSSNIRDLINQRKRWVSKSVNYNDLDIISLSILVLMTNLIICILFIGSFFHQEWLFIFSISFILKFFIDLIFIYPILNFFNNKLLLKWSLLFEFLYSFYILFIVIYSFSSKFEWKGRKLSK